MPDEKVTKLANDTYERIKERAERESITMSEAARRLVEEGGRPPTSCELSQFRQVLEDKGLKMPQAPSWFWKVIDGLPASVVVGTKLEPYKEAYRETQIRCTFGDELYERLITQEAGPVEAVAEATPPEQTEPEPATSTSLIAEAEVGAGTEAPTSAEAESTEEVESVEPAEPTESEVR